MDRNSLSDWKPDIVTLGNCIAKAQNVPTWYSAESLIVRRHDKGIVSGERDKLLEQGVSLLWVKRSLVHLYLSNDHMSLFMKAKPLPKLGSRE